jgi:hypothetical protein
MRVLVAGALANKPRNGGEAWVRLSWVRGLLRLGIDAWLIEQIAPEVCTGADARPSGVIEGSINLQWFERVVKAAGLEHRAALLDPAGTVAHGPPLPELLELAVEADLLINISGNLTHARLLAAPHSRAYLDLDPGYSQIWNLQGLLGSALAAHEHHLTVATAIGTNACTIADDGVRWQAVLPPVVLEDWPVLEQSLGSRFTTVASWRGGYGRLEHAGHVYGQKAHEYRRHVQIPELCPEAIFEVALAYEPDDGQDAIALQAHGWRLVDPLAVAGQPDDFRRYVTESAGELSPAQGVYVETRSGWFSDRTSRYLAAGRPAIVQDTGVATEVLPSGVGLLTFQTPAEAAAAVRLVLADYDAHAQGARELAEAYLDSDVVITEMLGSLL